MKIKKRITGIVLAAVMIASVFSLHMGAVGALDVSVDVIADSVSFRVWSDEEILSAPAWTGEPIGGGDGGGIQPFSAPGLLPPGCIGDGCHAPGCVLMTWVEWCYRRETFTPIGQFAEPEGLENLLLYTMRWDPSNPERTRWFPLLGPLNVSRIVPTAGRGLAIAFRRADLVRATGPMSVMGTQGVIPVSFVSRPVLDRATIGYTHRFGGGMFQGSSRIFPENNGTIIDGRPADHPSRPTDTFGMTVHIPPPEEFAVLAGRSDTMGWAAFPGSGLTSSMFPMGGTVEIRRTVGVTRNDDILHASMPTITPLSTSARLSIRPIPRAPMPRITTRRAPTGEMTSTIALTDRMEFMVFGAEEIQDAAGNFTTRPRQNWVDGLLYASVRWPDSSPEPPLPASGTPFYGMRELLTGHYPVVSLDIPGHGELVTHIGSSPWIRVPPRTRQLDLLNTTGWLPVYWAGEWHWRHLRPGDIIVVRNSATDRAPASHVWVHTLTANDVPNRPPVAGP
jgi:hypothetical protein